MLLRSLAKGMRHELFLSYLLAAVSVASRDLALSVCFPLACDEDVAGYISNGKTR